MKIVKVQYDCGGCGKRCSTTNHNLRYRQHRKNESFCTNCLIRLEKSAAVFAAVPLEYHRQIFLGRISHTIAEKYLMEIPTFLKVFFDCNHCGKKCELKWAKMLCRRHCRGEPTCYRCIQSRINTTGMAIEAHRARGIKLWQDPVFAAAGRKNMEIHRRRIQLDEEYAARYRRRCRSISGTVIVGGQAIRFDSAYELLFVVAVKPQCTLFRRCEYPIAYGNHTYHPDFFLVCPSGLRIIAEVKGYYDNRVREKQDAAIRYLAETGIADAYVLYDCRKLVADGIVEGLGGAHMWRQIRRIYKNVSITFADQKHQRIAEIGYSRYRKETQNHQNHQDTLSG